MSESLTSLLVEWQARGEHECFSRLVEAAQLLIEHSATRQLRRSRLCTPVLLDEIRSRVWDHLRRLHPYAADERAAAAFRPVPDGDETAGIRYVRWLTQRRALDVLRQERRRLRRCPTMTEAQAEHHQCPDLERGQRDSQSSDAEGSELNAAIESLTQPERRVVQMILDGTTQVVIARSLKLSEATVSRLRGKALVHLRRLLFQEPKKRLAAIPASTDLQCLTVGKTPTNRLPCATIQYQVRASTSIVLERRYGCYAFCCLLDGEASLTWVRKGKQQTSQEKTGTCNFFVPDDATNEFLLQPTRETLFHTVLVPPEYFEEVVPKRFLRPLFGFRDLVTESLVRSLCRHRQTGDDVSQGCAARLLVLRLLELQGCGLADWQHDESVFTAYEINQLIEYADAHLSRHIMLRQWAQVPRLSPSHFDRKFHRSFGVSPSRFIAVRRVQRVIDLMGGTEDPISSIARRVGFCSPSHCANTFRALIGVTPSQFRTEATCVRTRLCPRPDEVTESAESGPA